MTHTVNTAKALALPFVAALLTACATHTPPQPTQLAATDWPMPVMHLGDDRGLPRGVEPCQKRGCDNHKLFFNPAKPEPDATTLHRGW